MLGDIGSVDTSTPNTRYKSQYLGTWSSIEDVDNFLSTCNHSSEYYGATIGSYVTIKDGTYNKQWVIAGFDCEKNHKASDGNIKDNGYGICLIPRMSLGNAVWNPKKCDGYYESEIHKTTLSAVATNLKKVLGSHLVQRNVLLSSARDYYNNWVASAYTWTTANCTLMSAGQITGTFASNKTKYDDGEANYRLPLFNYETWSFDTHAWLRGLSGHNGNIDFVYTFITSGSAFAFAGSNSYGLRPLIYIR